MINFSRVDCTGNELEYVKEVLDSGWLTTASKAAEFECRFSSFVGAEYALAVNSCTSALHLALEAVGVEVGDKVLVPAMTFTASAEVIRYLGADPVFLDVEYSTSLVTEETVAKALQQHGNVKALVVVHFAGQAAHMAPNMSGAGILELCHRHGVKIVEDAAHAFPARSGETMIGNIGDVTCFSFYANKTITTGEGGMLTTNNDEIASRVRLMRLHGIDRDVWDRFTSKKPAWEYDVTVPGYKYNMPDLNAAIGLAQLERAEQMREARQKIAEIYLEELSGVEGLDLPQVVVPMGDHAWHLFPVVLNENSMIERNAMISLLAEDGIGTSVHYKPLYRMSYYRDKYSLVPTDFPNCERIWRGCFSLPIYSLLSNVEVSYVAKHVKKHLNMRA